LDGTCSNVGSQPWMAQIQLKYAASEDNHHCGGTILSEDMILTASHCLSYFYHDMKVVVGQYYQDRRDPNEQIFDIEDVTQHKSWDSIATGTFSNDIAIIKLRQPIVFSKNVYAATLPTSDIPADTNCTVIGWGKTHVDQFQKPYSNCLREVTVPIVGFEECQKMYENDPSRIKVLKGMMCAGYKEGGKDSCGADSGGPLICKVNGEKHIQGIVSWGTKCGSPNKPGVYTNVKHYLPWIRKTMTQYSG